MSNDVRHQIDLALATVTPIVHGIEADQWGASTPCAAWDAHAVLNHLVGGAHIFAAQLDGREPTADHDTDWLGNQPTEAWDVSAAADHAAWRRPEALTTTIELGIGALPGEIAAWVHLTELVVHGADLAVATGQEDLLDQDLAAGLLEALHMLGFEAFRMPASFGTELDTGADSLPHQRLLAYLGRPMASVTARSTGPPAA